MLGKDDGPATLYENRPRFSIFDVISVYHFQRYLEIVISIVSKYLSAVSLTEIALLKNLIYWVEGSKSCDFFWSKF